MKRLFLSLILMMAMALPALPQTTDNIKNLGTVKVTGGTITGVTNGGIKNILNQGTADDEIESYASDDIDHGMTDVVGTNIYGFVSKLIADNGGLNLTGLSDADTPGLTLTGIVGSNTPTFPALAFSAKKKNGTTTADIGDTEYAYGWYNGLSLLGYIKGNGAATFTSIEGTPIGDVTPAAGTFTNLTGTVSDYDIFTIDAGNDTVTSAPSAAQRYQGAVGSDISGTAANVSYAGTCTTSGANFTTCSWATSGTQTATLTIANLTVGKLYRLRLTPTLTSGAMPALTLTSGATVYSSLTLTTAVQASIYFRATATSVVLTFTNTAASTWATASTDVYEYTRPVIARAFSNATQQGLIFDWKPPADWNAGTIKIKPYGIVTASTAPANGETIIFSFSGFCVAASGSTSTATGTAVSSTFTADATYAQYDEWIGAETTAITLAGAAAGSKCFIMVDRLTSDTYEQLTGLTGFVIHYTRTLTP